MSSPQQQSFFKAEVTLSNVHDSSDVRSLSLSLSEPCTVGRASNSLARNHPAADTNALYDCPVISRKHARLEAHPWTPWPEQITVTDLGSMHGTRVNGTFLKPRVAHSLRAGDQIQLGGPVARGSESHEGVLVTFDRMVNDTQANQSETQTQGRGFQVPDFSDDDNDSHGPFSENDDAPVKSTPPSEAPLPQLVKIMTGSQQKPVDLDVVADSVNAKEDSTYRPEHFGEESDVVDEDMEIDDKDELFDEEELIDEDELSDLQSDLQIDEEHDNGSDLHVYGEEDGSEPDSDNDEGPEVFSSKKETSQRQASSDLKSSMLEQERATSPTVPHAMGEPVEDPFPGYYTTFPTAPAPAPPPLLPSHPGYYADFDRHAQESFRARDSCGQSDNNPVNLTRDSSSGYLSGSGPPPYYITDGLRGPSNPWCENYKSLPPSFPKNKISIPDILERPAEASPSYDGFGVFDTTAGANEDHSVSRPRSSRLRPLYNNTSTMKRKADMISSRTQQAAEQVRTNQPRYAQPMAVSNSLSHDLKADVDVLGGADALSTKAEPSQAASDDFNTFAGLVDDSVTCAGAQQGQNVFSGEEQRRLITFSHPSNNDKARKEEPKTTTDTPQQAEVQPAPDNQQEEVREPPRKRVKRHPGQSSSQRVGTETLKSGSQRVATEALKLTAYATLGGLGTMAFLCSPLAEMALEYLS